MKIVFIVTSFWAYGELLIAKEFAENLKNNGNKVLFLIPPSHKNSLDKSFKYVSFIPNSRNINRIIMYEVQEKFKPDIVILSDFLNYSFAYRHYGITIEDLEIFKCKIATFDNFDWLLKRKCMDTYGYVSDIPKKVDINRFGDRIIACPLGNPLISCGDNEYRYSLFQSLKLFEKDEKEFLKSSMTDFVFDKKVILVSSAKWQESYINEQKVEDFIELSNQIFRKLVNRLAINNIIVFIGNEQTDNYSNNPNIRFYKSMPANEFDKFIKISDMYIGRNITSTSMIRIALSGIQCVNIENSFSSLNNELIQKLLSDLGEDVNAFDINKIYKFKMFPVGWYDFLNPLFKDNPYSEIVESCELFDSEATYNKIESLLNDQSAHQNMIERVKKFNSVLNTLMSPTDIIKQIIQN